jgi:hypothetical protein
MSDVRTSFPILEDATQAGVALHKVLEGDAAAGKNALAALVGKKPDGSLAYLTLDAAGNIAVTMDGGGTSKRARGTATGATTVTTVCEIALTPSATYRGLSWLVSCFRDAIYEVALINDPSGTPTEVILADMLVGSGDLTDSGALKEVAFTAGADDPVLRLRAKNLTVASDFRGTITTTEDAA